MKESDRIARMLGHGYAHFQHTLDKGISWGLGKMRESSKKPEKVIDPEASQFEVQAKRAAKSTMRFVGELGSSYFEKYEELKRRGRSPK